MHASWSNIIYILQLFYSHSNVHEALPESEREEQESQVVEEMCLKSILSVILIMWAHWTSPPSRRPAFTAEPSHSVKQETSDTAEFLCF